MPFLLVLLSLASFAFAGFDKATIKNLDFEYTAPYGKGTVEKVSLGFSLAPEVYPIEVNRTESSFELITPFLDVSWKNPWKFFHDLEMLSTNKLNLNVGGKKHTLTIPYISMRPKERGEYKAENVEASCEGSFAGKLDIRLFEDCREKMAVRAKKVDLPTDFILYRILYDAPSIPREIDVPAYDLEFTSSKGNYSLLFTFKYIFLARLRAYGHFQYENNYKTIAIRVDQVKFGYLPVTSFVMRRLKEINKNPNVTINPPWIRINVRNDEGQSN
ncbi:hypothetical protein ACJVC5_15155 [Peredibacter sp. HCB2-198]|uniref:hypothetical protein n=1 Tax=Peredibacter sp. HCB2-198 TaxID=3383025 RepID=UPI0038B6AFC0